MKKKEINAGYEIIERFPIGEQGFAIGYSDTAPASYVTWQYRTAAPMHFFWGHYAPAKEAAYEDYRNRIIAEIDYAAEYTHKKPLLPLFCYAQKPSSGEIIKIERGFKGHELATSLSTDDNAERNRTIIDYHNRSMGVSRAQEEAMLAGSMFGWQTKAADPRSYDENGPPKCTKKRDEPER